MIFAAGYGQRMRPLTEHTPKPLLNVGGKRLIEWHLERLAAAGITDVVINIAHLASQFAPALGDGARYGLHIHYSDEGERPLETGGGMLRALPLLGPDPFIAINGDIWCDLDLGSLPSEPAGEAHLVLVDNPPHHPLGDFQLRPDGHIDDREADTPALTFAGIGVYAGRQLLDARIRQQGAAKPATPRFALAPVLREAMHRGAVFGQHFTGHWADIGTPQRLAELDAHLRR
nr:nucleotidyltransferase family protein [Oleiagrimonas sp. C23AA]